MDGSSSNKTSGATSLSRKGSSLPFKSRDSESQNAQCCNRIGCSARFHPLKGNSVGYAEKPKPSRHSCRTLASSKSAVGTSRTLPYTPGTPKKPLQVQHAVSGKEINIASSSNRERLTEIPTSSTTESQSDVSDLEQMEDSHTPRVSIVQDTSVDECTSRITSTSRDRKRVYQKSDHSCSISPMPSLSKKNVLRQPNSSRQSNEPSASTSRGLGSNASRYNLASLTCTSSSDVLPSRLSTVESRERNRVQHDINRRPDGSSSTRGKNINNPHIPVNASSRRSIIPSRTISFTSNPPSLQPSIRPATIRDGATSVRTRRLVSKGPISRSTESAGVNDVSGAAYGLVPPSTETEFSDATSVSSSSMSGLADISALRSISSIRIGYGNDNTGTRPSTRHESSTRAVHGVPVDRDALWSYNIDGVAEVLFALDRIEQEELTYEQLLVLETNLLGGLGYHDQHRDMRLDIDNMTYEELLALEERMGNVSTALTEEKLAECLTRGFYKSEHGAFGTKSLQQDDVKCSICQEEYVHGDEVGRLCCGHFYHVCCIHGWLRLKNWCPICKSSAEPS